MTRNLTKHEKGTKNYWSDCEQVFFCAGRGYGLTNTLNTICLGKDNDINTFLETRQLNDNLNSIQRQVLNGILEYRKEQGIGQPDTRTTDMVRASNIGPSGHKPKATRLFAPKKRLPVRLSRQKSKGLSRQ